MNSIEDRPALEGGGISDLIGPICAEARRRR
jgi:hypothetical protein